jgi:hypothetical protein
MNKLQLFYPLIILLFFNPGYGQVVRDNGQTIYVDYTEVTPVLRASWIEPKNDKVRNDNPDIKLKIGIKANFEPRITRITLNENDFDTMRGLSIAQSLDTSFNRIVEKSVKLEEGINTIYFEIVNEKGDTVRLSKQINYALPEMDRRDFALLFASDNYTNWSKLNNPISDAESVSEELTDRYGFMVSKNYDVTREQISDKIREYAQKHYEPNDQLFIFFAGHGQFDELYKEGYIVCKDSQVNDKSKGSYISYSDLRNWINRIRCDHIYLVLDVCYAGAFDQSIANRGTEENYMMNNRDFILSKLKYKSRIYLTSGGKEYVSDGVPGHHSPFTAQLLEALRSSGGEDKFLTTGEVYRYVEKLDQHPVQNWFGDHEPGGEFFFVAKLKLK